MPAGGDAASRLLTATVAMLPSGRLDWGRAMQAELAAVEPRRDRWSFAWGCVRATVAQHRVLLGVTHLVAVLGVLAGVYAWTATIDFPPLVWVVNLVASALAVVCWQGRRAAMLGPVGDGAAAWSLRIVGYLVAGGIVVACVAHVHPATQQAVDDGTGVLLLSVALASYVLGLVTVSARRSAATRRVLVSGAAGGIVAALVWLATVLVWPPIPPSTGAAVVLAGAAAVLAAALNGGPRGSRARGLLAALLAGTAATALIFALVVGLAHYGPDSLIPNITPHAFPADRVAESRIEIVDPYILVLVLGCLVAAALGVASVVTHPSRTRPPGAFGWPGGGPPRRP